MGTTLPFIRSVVNPVKSTLSGICGCLDLTSRVCRASFLRLSLLLGVKFSDAIKLKHRHVSIISQCFDFSLRLFISTFSTKTPHLNPESLMFFDVYVGGCPQLSNVVYVKNDVDYFSFFAIKNTCI